MSSIPLQLQYLFRRRPLGFPLIDQVAVMVEVLGLVVGGNDYCYDRPDGNCTNAPE